MHGLPKEIDLNFLLSKTLVQACFGEQDLILNFCDGISITVMSCIGCADTSGEIQQHEDFRRAAPSIFALLSKSLVSWEANENGTLALGFEGGTALMIYDDSRQFESYVIKHGDRLIVV